MEQARRRLRAEFLSDGPAQRVEILDHMRVVVMGRIGARVLPMAAHVEDDHVEIGQKSPPEMEIAVDDEAVAVADEEARSLRIAVPSRLQHRPVRARDGENRAWFRKLR